MVPFDPEVFKLVALDLLDEAGVRFLFHAFASDVILDQWHKETLSLRLNPDRLSSKPASSSIAPVTETWLRARERRTKSAEKTTG